MKARKAKRKSKRKIARPVVMLPEFVRNTKKRRCIEVAIPHARLWVCDLNGHRIAFLKGDKKFPVGIIEGKRKRKKDYLLLVRPFDSTEHGRIVKHLCLR